MSKEYFKELKHYTFYEISKKLNVDTDEAKYLIGILKKYGIVKTVNKLKPEYEDLSNKDIVLNDVVEDHHDVVYVFDFVGVILLEGYVFKCYPKYIKSMKEPLSQLKKIMKVIQKYNSKEQIVYLHNGEDEGEIFNYLAISIHLFGEYFTYGLYSNDQEIIEMNGEGEIMWDRTINETFSLIKNRRPYYVEVQTRRNMDNDMDYFKRLHACVLSMCSQELRVSGLLDLFDIPEVQLTSEKLEDFGNIDYVLYRIQNEIRAQFETRKQNLLKTLYTFIAHDKIDRNGVKLSLYGTNSFNLIWERVCADSFGNILNESLESLEKRGLLPSVLADKYKFIKTNKLVSIIGKPEWHKNNPAIRDNKIETLRPDMICSYKCNDYGEYCFGIYDAKYYCVEFDCRKDGWKVTGQPGIGDITKQYLYQLAFSDFIKNQKFQYVQNMFLCPQEETDKDFGYVEMKMFNDIDDKSLAHIAIVKLCAEELYDFYLSGKKIETISKYIPRVAQKSVPEQNFATRIMLYSSKIRKDSLAAELKMEMESNENTLIYPKQLNREVGAKLIYDVICPVSIGIFYGFDPYEKTYDNLVAENAGNSHGICSQIADASLEMERRIKVLSESELEDEKKVQNLIKECFNNKPDIGVMTKGRTLEKLCENIMELTREVYL